MTKKKHGKGPDAEATPDDKKPDTSEVKSSKPKSKKEAKPKQDPSGPHELPSYCTWFGSFLLFAAAVSVFAVAGYNAYKIRLYAINTYGRVIHEFDPWFNMRATQYLYDNGWYEFFHWFDHRSWYPLGRPVGTTIYPGMQISAVCIWSILDRVGDAVRMSINDVCVFVPVWFGVSATCFLGLLSAECANSWSAGAIGALIMAIIPAHIMRSVGGGYDNESIAMTAMTGTFFLWTRSLRADPKLVNGEPTRDSYLFGVLTGLMYIYMAAAWGGYVFVVNMVAIHAAALVCVGRYSSKLHRAYSLFYVIGTAGAIQVPVIGLTPLRSLEQMAPLLVFLIFQVLEIAEVQRRKQNLTIPQTWLLRFKFGVPILILGVVAAMALQSIGYFGPLSARVRGLFVPHTRTGNPLVDSVAEHQPASERAYSQYLHHLYHVAPYGMGVCIVLSLLEWRDSRLFLVCYGFTAYFFSNKMARLIILLGPVASALGGIALGFAMDQLVVFPLQEIASTALKKVFGVTSKVEELPAPKTVMEQVNHTKAVYTRKFSSIWNMKLVCVLRIVVGLYAIKEIIPYGEEFYKYSHELAEGMSQPSIMFKARLQNGKEIIVDDYREAYWWLRDNTPEDARVMSWWDYGYQISGIANRTTIADGNTWNHEHIATLGKILSAPEEEAHKYARHLADYVLVWAGGGGDDLAKSPHMARIGNSVFLDICPGDPTCSTFGFYQGGIPTPMMEECLLYKMVRFHPPSITLSSKRFTHAFTSRYGKVRIFKVERVSKKSKKWNADPANRICDAPGSWYCVGQYPPALADLISRRKNFAQLEDFNVKKDKASTDYQEEYLARMEGRTTGKSTGKTPPKPEAKDLKVKFVGCFAKESDLGSDKEYGGGNSGANMELAKGFAQRKGKKYVAVARVDQDGHSFVFDEPPSGTEMKDDGCLRSCLYGNQAYSCGCADEGCGDLSAPDGEDNVRRWAVYEVPPKKQKKKKDKKKKKKKKKEEL